MRVPWQPKPLLHKRTWSFVTDAFVVGAGLALLFGVLETGRSLLGPFAPVAVITASPSALPAYAAYSLARIAIAYIFSLIFAIAYGYLAATNPRAERLMIPLLDVLQSIPVLSFLPGVMLAMVALFPHRQLGIELGSILLIFTGQVWNIAFSFYSSMKAIPREFQEVCRVYRFSWLQRFLQLELPYATLGIVWNSMMSVAGGWFFLMACEMFVLGDRDFRLPGLGSYLQTAASAGDVRAILCGLAAMIAVIVLLDQLVWRPVIAWAEKFKFEQVESAPPPRSPVLDALRRSRLLFRLRSRLLSPIFERILRAAATRSLAGSQDRQPAAWLRPAGRMGSAAVLLGIAYGTFRAGRILLGLTVPELTELLRGAWFTFLRVNAALLLGSLWTIPAGVAIGSSPRLARFAQPLAQIAASVPATALFPVVLLILLRLGGGMNLGALGLMLLGTQWYILFNVIAGAMAIPTDLKEVSRVFRFGLLARWRRLILPAIFPYLVTGLVTASGGAWNASVVSEYFHFRGRILSTTGLGGLISKASDSGNFDLLLAATVVMAAIVVATNRLVWHRLYRLAETRYKLET